MRTISTQWLPPLRINKEKAVKVKVVMLATIYQDVWKWKSARPKTSRKARYAGETFISKTTSSRDHRLDKNVPFWLYTLFSYKNVVFSGQAEYSYFSADFSLKIFLYYFFLSLQNPPNPAIWLVPRAGGFLRSCPLTRAESLAALFTSLFVVCEWAKPVIFNHFLLKLALLLALAREKWILLFRQNIWSREKLASQPGKPVR